MAYELPELPYPYDALEPYIDEETMRLHYAKHHATYVANLNAALENHPEADPGNVDILIAELDSAPEEERLMLTVERLDDGEVSIYLTDVLIAGDKLELRGPIGGYFTWEEGDGGPLLLVGGGSGVVPLMAVIRHQAAAGSDVPTRLLYSSRSYEEIIFREELEYLAARDGSLEVIHTLTRSRPGGWAGYDRRIDAQMLREVAWSPGESPLAFVCGSTPFVEGVADALVSLGHDPARVKTERFGPTGG